MANIYDSLFNNGVGSGIIVGGESQLEVLSNARLDGTIVQQDGSVDVKSNAVLNNTTATGNGNITLEANAKADGTVLKDNSSMQVSGSIQNTVVSSAGHSTAAGNQLAGGRFQVIVFAIHLDPPSQHMPGIIKVIVCAVDFLQCAGHLACPRIHVVFVCAVAEPSGEHLAQGQCGGGIHIEIIIISVILLPSGEHLTI